MAWWKEWTLDEKLVAIAIVGSALYIGVRLWVGAA
jgi:hypothetical protein